MIKKKIGILMAGLMMIGLLQACGGGGGGSDAPVVPATLAVSGTGSDDASVTDRTYTFTAGNYAYTIDKFAPLDKLVFPAGSVIDVQQEVFGNTEVLLLSSVNGTTVTVKLTSLNPTDDSKIRSAGDLNTVFGPSTVTP